MFLTATLRDNAFKMKLWLERILRVLVSAFAYYLAVQIGLVFVVQPEGLAAVWPASGVALAILLLSPIEMRTALLGTIFVVNTGSNLLAGNTMPVSLGFALGNTLEPALGAWILTRAFGKSFDFTRLSHLFGLLGVATIANALTAMVGALTPTIAFGGSYWNVWLVWWLPNGLGILLLTPLILVWTIHRVKPGAFTIPRFIEGLFIGLGLLFIVLVLPSINEDKSSPALILAGVYIVFPLLTWAATRFELHGATTMLVLLNFSTLGSAANHMGVFTIVGDSKTAQLLSAQLYVGVLSVTTLAMAVIVWERKQLGLALSQTNNELRVQVEKGAELHQALREQALRDPLTGLYNRRYLFDMLQQEFSRAKREEYPVSLVLMDMDRFKHINDTCGHDAGDAVLKAVSAILLEAVRFEDIVCRYGGDEFLVVLHNTTTEHAQERVGQWLAKIKNTPLDHAGTILHMSASAGIATYPEHGQNPEQIIKQADLALLNTKGQSHRTGNNHNNGQDYLR